MTTIEQTGAEEVAWDLSDLYASGDDPRIESDFAEAEAAAAAFRERYYGNVATLSAGALAEAIDERERIEAIATRALYYAHMHFSTNMADPTRGALVAKLGEKGAGLETQLLFFGLEWAAIEDGPADELLADPALDHWRHWLSAQRVFRPYLLTEPEEKIITEKAVSGVSAWSRLYEEVLGALRVDLGDAEPVSLETAMAKLYSSDREERRGAAEAVTVALEPGLRTRTSIFNTILVDKWIDDRLRGYPTWISSRNLANETTDDAVQALVDATTSRYDVPQRYYRLKAKLLGLDKLEYYDRFAPVADDSSKTPWDEARRVVCEAYSDFSGEAGAAVERFFDDGWIDAPVRPDKRHGAYCATNVPGVHPYVFMNYTGDRRSILTLAHELGHALHGTMAQPLGLFNASTPLTTAETASVFGEALTFKRLLASEDDPRRRLDLLTGQLEDAIATTFRQIAMNRFENLVHTRAARARRALHGPPQRALARVPVRPLRRLGRRRRLRHLVELHPALHERARLCVRLRVRLSLRARHLPLVRARGRRDRRSVSRPLAGRGIEGAGGARADGRARSHRSVDLGERDRGALGGSRRGRAARSRDRARLTPTHAVELHGSQLIHAAGVSVKGRLRSLRRRLPLTDHRST